MNVASKRTKSMKRNFLILGLVAVAAFGAAIMVGFGGATAAIPPANAEQCLKLASDMTEAVAKNAPAAETKAKLDELFGKLKSACDAGAFADAMRTTEAIREAAGIKN